MFSILQRSGPINISINMVNTACVYRKNASASCMHIYKYLHYNSRSSKIYYRVNPINPIIYISIERERSWYYHFHTLHYILISCFTVRDALNQSEQTSLQTSHAEPLIFGILAKSENTPPAPSPWLSQFQCLTFFNL